MAVRVVTNPFPRLRCLSCGERVDGVQLPCFDFGDLGDHGDVELLEGDRFGKSQAHDDLLVCAGCVRKAASLLPGAGEVESRAAARVAEAEAERDRAVALAASLSGDVSRQLQGMVGADPAATDDQAAQDDDQEDSSGKLPPDLDGMTVRERRAFAKDHGIKIPADATKAAEIRAIIEDALTSPGER